jgi:hypothetical protein
MSGARNEYDRLIEAAELDTKPAFVFVAHVGANDAGGNFAPIGMRPPDTARADVCAAPDKSLSSQPVQI